MKIPAPQQIGLPPKFKAWRTSQEDAIHNCLTSDKRAVVICAPTGYGKQAVALAAAKLSAQPTCIVTSSKGLQDQYQRDGNGMGMVDLRGRRNYQCEMREDFTCQDGHAARCPYRGTVGCPSSNAEMRAAASPLVVTNYDKWIAARRFGTGMHHFTQVIFDEAHHAVEAIGKAMQVVLSRREVEQDLKLKFLKGGESEDLWAWKRWASTARIVANDALEEAKGKIEGVADPKPHWVRQYTHMHELCRKLSIVALANPNDWVVEEIEDGFKFDPIRTAKYAESTLLLKVPRLIFISATIRPKTMYMLGLGKDKFDFREFDSDFDPSRCPIYYIPTMRVDRRNPDLRMLWARLDQIAARRTDRKGLVQTISFARQQEALATSRFYDSMLINERGEAPTGIIEEFRRSRPGSILVSPSIGTGYDFPRQDAEWQFVCKIPFEPPSKIVKAREEDDPDRRGYQAMQGLIQMIGRIMRSKDDQGESFLPDEHLQWFLPRYGHLAPKWFHGFFRTVTTVPPPPPPLVKM